MSGLVGVFTRADLATIRAALFIYRQERKHAKAPDWPQEESELLALSAKISLAIGDHHETSPRGRRWDLMIRDARPDEDPEK